MDVPLPDGFRPNEGLFPTYKVLLQLKESADELDSGVPCSGPQKLLSNWITKIYPTIKIQRPGRFYSMVERLQLPTTGPKALKGDDLVQYLSRTWVQRNCKGICISKYSMFS